MGCEHIARDNRDTTDGRNVCRLGPGGYSITANRRLCFLRRRELRRGHTGSPGMSVADRPRFIGPRQARVRSIARPALHARAKPVQDESRNSIFLKRHVFPLSFIGAHKNIYRVHIDMRYLGIYSATSSKGDLK